VYSIPGDPPAAGYHMATCGRHHARHFWIFIIFSKLEKKTEKEKKHL
jgi:hypothetical protein